MRMNGTSFFYSGSDDATWLYTCLYSVVVIQLVSGIKFEHAKNITVSVLPKTYTDRKCVSGQMIAWNLSSHHLSQKG